MCFSLLGLRCMCDKFSKTVGFENGNPLCVTCGPNMTVTADGGDCILRANATCKCSTNQIKCNLNNFSSKMQFRKNLKYKCKRSM